jgi:thiol-disulfide isomerase/thioredoxin
MQQTDSVLKLVYKNMPPATASFTSGRIIATESKTWPLETFETYAADFKKHYPKSNYNAELENVLKELKRFYPGHPAADFSFKTLDGKEMKLSDLKGKVVYMDFWASWCGPCKGEMPFAKRVKEHFKDNENVVFLYVSIDEKEDAWKNGINSLGISGMHTRTPGWGGEIAQLYKIQSVPSYFLIDKNGKFVVNKTPRPSQTDEVIKLIEGLL